MQEQRPTEGERFWGAQRGQPSTKTNQMHFFIAEHFW